MKNHPINDILTRLSKKERKTVMARMVKLQEESGELAVAILQNHGLKGGKKSQAAIHDNILEEGVDVIIIALSILGAYKFTEKDVMDRMKDKLKKWEKIIHKKY
jgi:NTP pyrophosphatase (non-canonical NTP hydrolase)